MPPTDTLYIKPSRAGLIVRDPRTAKPLAEAGETKPRSGYWLRRLRSGDVIETQAPPKPKATKE